MKVDYINPKGFKVTVTFTASSSGVWCVLEAEEDKGIIPTTYPRELAHKELVSLGKYPAAIQCAFVYNAMAKDGITHLGAMYSQFPLNIDPVIAFERCVEDVVTVHGEGALLTDFKKI